MTKRRTFPLEQARRYAAEFCSLLTPAVHKIEPVDAIRRAAPTCGDIVLLALPVVLAQRGLFDDHERAHYDLLLKAFDELQQSKVYMVKRRMRTNGEVMAWNDKHKAVEYQARDGQWVNVDVYWATQWNWGVQLALRTGPAELAWQMRTPVGEQTRDGRPGLLPPHLKISGGHLREYTSSRPITCATEEDFLRRLNYDIAPEERH